VKPQPFYRLFILSGGRKWYLNHNGTHCRLALSADCFSADLAALWMTRGYRSERANPEPEQTDSYNQSAQVLFDFYYGGAE
jgi:hypothetical protein